jgi:hypothetical protein
MPATVNVNHRERQKADEREERGRVVVADNSRWKLIEPTNRSGSLRYRETDVPNEGIAGSADAPPAPKPNQNSRGWVVVAFAAGCMDLCKYKIACPGRAFSGSVTLPM